MYGRELPNMVTVSQQQSEVPSLHTGGHNVEIVHQLLRIETTEETLDSFEAKQWTYHMHLDKAQLSILPYSLIAEITKDLLDCLLDCQRELAKKGTEDNG